MHNVTSLRKERFYSYFAPRYGMSPFVFSFDLLVVKCFGCEGTSGFFLYLSAQTKLWG